MKEYKVIDFGDRVEWYNLEGMLHREGGPAVECKDGEKFWYINGLPHRKDGPAHVSCSGLKEHNHYFINGIEITEEEFELSNKDLSGLVVEIYGKNYLLKTTEYRADLTVIKLKNS